MSTETVQLHRTKGMLKSEPNRAFGSAPFNRADYSGRIRRKEEGVCRNLAGNVCKRFDHKGRALRKTESMTFFVTSRK